jgi:predicted DNA-binding transcriptional regulator YafY
VDLDLLQEVDPVPIDERVWEAALRAAREHRKLSFNYLSPRHADRQPRYHEVAPYRIHYRQGHWYLHAYDLSWRDWAGQEGANAGFRHFRLHYIQSDERLVISPTVLPPMQRRPPKVLVHYRLLPALGRGSISRHFQEMQITRFPDGSAEVRGYTDDDWQAARILMGYGQNCVALGGEEVLRRVLEAVRGMVKNYGIGM